MKWIIVIVIGAVVAFWLYRGRSRNSIEDPDVKTFEKKDYYLTPDDNESDDESSPDNRNPRH
ncbi:hypothetical protein [Marinobacter zhejiangensis]|uniref:Uncharacterized protein n=1 Tax=Marinobacter zhejiangensis TaxID=488535 RepID=A0A1I4PZ35_9GAMM|nr:hypothetical protein [Marinobacter zhejiangensis]SFM32645.1 hypothetical protein SAMN04487963_2062 [Marinobacter zhejiangensis]